MDLFYNLGIRAYKAAVRIASIKNRKARLMLHGQAHTMAKLQQAIKRDGQGYIWIHASSLGEFEQARPLIEMIKKKQPQARIVLTFFSPSGYEVRKNYDMADVVCYLPFDLSGNVKRFLNAVQPTMAIFVKYDFWGNYLMELKRRHIPTYIISAIFRPTQAFFRPWGGMFRKMLECFTTLFVQNEESRSLLEGIGINNVTIAGDTRFDRVATVCNAAREFPLIEQMVKDAQFTMVMGSSWEPDEDIVIPYFNAHPEMKLIIAPHEFDRQRLLALMARIKRKTALYSSLTARDAAHTQCLIIDSFGLLSSLYRYGQVAYVGGGFGTGIHNINEAAVYGMPVIFGPRYDKFREAHDLIACQGAFAINGADDFTQLMDRFIADDEHLKSTGRNAAAYIRSNLGATATIYSHIFA